MNKIATTLGAAALGLTAYTQADFPSTMIDPSVQVADFCSGTVIIDPYMTDGVQKTILTARHCVQKVGQELPITIANHADMRESSKATFNFKVAFISDESDLAILQYFGEDQSNFNLPEAVIYKGDLEFGQKAWIVGYPLGLPKLVTDGYLGWIKKISELQSMSKSTEFQQFAIDLMGGSSGGGLFVQDEFGWYNLAGVVSAGIMNMYSVSTPWGSATPLDEIRKFLSNIQGQELGADSSVVTSYFDEVPSGS